MKRWAGRFSFLVNACFAAILFGAVFPGTHRVVCPNCFGLVEIAPRVWSDRPANAPERLAQIARAKTTVAGYFGDAAPNPTVILCETRACARKFGIGGNGLSIADMAVMFSPGGLTLGTMTHEMTHSRLHRKMGMRNIWAQPFPTWFDEGLATYVAGHPRVDSNASAASRAAVRDVQRFWQWRPTFQRVGVGRAYGTAAGEVQRIENAIGHDRFVELIKRIEKGGDFDALLGGI